MTHSFILTGINEAAAFGSHDLFDETGEDPDSKYFSLSVRLEHRIKTFHIPGKDKRDITMRTSDIKTDTTGPLWGPITAVQNCVTEDRFELCKDIAEYGGPYEIQWAFGNMTAYCTAAEFSQGAGFPEPPDLFYLDDGSTETAFFGKWTLTFTEYND